MVVDTFHGTMIKRSQSDELRHRDIIHSFE